MENHNKAYGKQAFRNMIGRFFLMAALMLLHPVAATMAQSQRQEKFNPAQFERDLEAYVVKKAGLTAEESAKFLPIYREMRAKQRVVFDKMNLRHRPNFDDEKECERAIRLHDTNDIKLKHIQRTYHNKFLTIMSAKKLLKIIGAEDEFHRNALRKAGIKEPKR